MTVFVVWQREYRAPGQNKEPMPEIIGVYTTRRRASRAMADGPIGYYRQLKEAQLDPKPPKRP